MKLIVGLGNPGAQYELTRHNIGKRAVAVLAAAERLSFSADSKLQASSCFWVTSAGKALLAFPNVFMNLSGESVRRLVDYYKIQTEKELLIVVDDVAIPFGTLRLRESGSAGGHNGLASIEEHLGTQNYPRLRIGVGGHKTPQDAVQDFLGHKPLEDYVLENFTDGEEKAVPDLLKKAVQAVRVWGEAPFEEALNRVNGG